MDETGVLGLLEELSILLEDSKPVFGKNNLRQVDIAAAFDIMDEIRDLFPAEFSQARQIVRERQSLLDDAEVEANRMIEDARSQAITIASEQEIVRISQQQADTILADARELERQTRAGAEDYELLMQAVDAAPGEADALVRTVCTTFRSYARSGTAVAAARLRLFRLLEEVARNG